MMNDLSRHVVEVQRNGYTLLPNLINPEDLDRLTKAFDRIIREEAARKTDPEAHTNTHQVSYALIGKDPAFRQMAFHPTLLSLMMELLGPDFILSAFNGLDMRPKGKGQLLHMDQEDSTGALIISVNIVHMLDDFTEENGATRLVPGSHLQPWKRRGHDNGQEPRAVQITAPSGSVLAYSGGILHAGTTNRTALPRRAIHLFYCRNWVLPHWDLQKSLSASLIRSLSESEKQLLGFYHRPDWYDAFSGKKQRGRLAPQLESWWTRLRRYWYQ